MKNLIAVLRAGESGPAAHSLARCPARWGTHRIHAPGGCSSMVELLVPNQVTRVRFPSPAPRLWLHIVESHMVRGLLALLVLVALAAAVWSLIRRASSRPPRPVGAGAGGGEAGGFARSGGGDRDGRTQRSRGLHQAACDRVRHRAFRGSFIIDAHAEVADATRAAFRQALPRSPAMPRADRCCSRS